jgi:excisionase family DNA binding protein
MENIDDEPNLLTVPEAAHKLRISTRTIARLIADGQLDAPKIRRRRLVTVEGIKGLLRKQELATESV